MKSGRNLPALTNRKKGFEMKVKLHPRITTIVNLALAGILICWRLD